MKSIRGHLLSRLLPVFIFLWAGAGVAVYLSAKNAMEQALELDLREIVGALPFGPGSGTTTLRNLDEIARKDVGIYFQIWDEQGSRILKSNSLGQFEFQRPSVFPREGGFGNQELESGDKVRTLAQHISDPGGLGEIHLVVAISREEIASRLGSIILTIVILGVAGAVAFSILLVLSLNAGLRPLETIGNHSMQITGDTMKKRFPENDIPSELEPIVMRLNQLLSRLETSFVRERRFSDDLAHEIRTPVAAIHSIAEAAVAWPDEFPQENFEEIVVLSNQLRVIIEDMMILARIEQRRQELSSEEFDLREMVEECWQLQSGTAELRDVTGRIEIPDGHKIRTDPRLFRILISNLVSNAAEYTPEGGIFLIKAAAENPVVAISNPAPHLTKEDLPLLFDRMWRHEQSRTSTNHFGLGLSVVRACVDALGMTVSACLDENHVITFTVENYAKKCSSSGKD